MIDLYWTRQKLLDVEPITMILSNDDQYLYIGVQDRLLMTLPTKNFNDVKQSNYTYRGISSMVQSETTQN